MSTHHTIVSKHRTQKPTELKEKQTTAAEDLNTSLSARAEPVKRNIGNDAELDSTPAN